MYFDPTTERILSLDHECFFNYEIFVRECYVQLLEKMLDVILKANFEPSHLVAITGTPGMGKTTFLGFCYTFFKLYGIKVIAKHSSLNCIVYDGFKELVLTDKQVRSLLAKVKANKHKYIFLIDSNSGWTPVAGVGYIVILFASPDVNNFGHFSKNSATTILMPPWTSDELRSCFKMLSAKAVTNNRRDFYTQLVADFDEAYARWGGSIHFHLHPEVAQERFTAFLRSEELVMMVELISNIEISKSVPTSLKTKFFQAFLFRYPSDPIFRFPSPQLTREIVHVYMEKVTKTPELLLGVQGTLLGLTYEAYVFKTLLCENSELLPLPVQNQNGGEEKIPVVTSVEYYSDLPKEIVKGVLYRPNNCTNNGVDCFLEDFVIQITTNARHAKLNLGQLQSLISIHDVKVVLITLLRNKDDF